MKLYQFPISHYCEKVRWALDYKQIQFEVVNLLPGYHVAKAMFLSGKSTVPIIDDDGHVVRDSSDIIDYLEEQYPEHPLYPADEEQKSAVREWNEYLDRNVGPHIRRLCYHVLLERPDIVVPMFTQDGPFYGRPLMKTSFPILARLMRSGMAIHADGFGRSLDKFDTVVERMQASLSQKEYLVGDRFTCADLTAASLIAPLLLPSGYGVKYPEQVPDEVLKLRTRYTNILDWVTHIYTRYRNTS